MIRYFITSVIIIVIYGLSSIWYLSSNDGKNLKLTRYCAVRYDYIFLPGYYIIESIKGINNKVKYKNLIAYGLENEESPLSLTAYRFSVFYDNYRCALLDPDSYGDDFRDSNASQQGSSLGRTQFARFLNNQLAKAGLNGTVDGIGQVVNVKVNKEIDYFLEDSVNNYRNKIIAICNK